MNCNILNQEKTFLCFEKSPEDYCLCWHVFLKLFEKFDHCMKESTRIFLLDHNHIIWFILLFISKYTEQNLCWHNLSIDLQEVLITPTSTTIQVLIPSDDLPSLIQHKLNSYHKIIHNISLFVFCSNFEKFQLFYRDMTDIWTKVVTMVTTGVQSNILVRVKNKQLVIIMVMLVMPVM